MPELVDLYNDAIRQLGMERAAAEKFHAQRDRYRAALLSIKGECGIAGIRMSEKLKAIEQTTRDALAEGGVS